MIKVFLFAIAVMVGACKGFKMPALRNSGNIYLVPSHGSKKRKKKGKDCLFCEKAHSHNNSYCSATCAKQHKEGA